MPALTNYEPVPSGLSFALDSHPPYPGRAYVLSTPGDGATVRVDGAGSWTLELLSTTDGVNYEPFRSWSAPGQWPIDTTHITAVALRFTAWSDGVVSGTMVHGAVAKDSGTTPSGAHHVSHETGGTDQIVALDAAVLTSGTLPAVRLPTVPPLLGGTGVTTGLTQLNADNIAVGIVAHEHLPADLARKPIPLADLPANLATKPLPIGDGGTGVVTGLTVLNADALAAGTVPDARLSVNVQMKPIGAADLPAGGVAPLAHHASHEPGGSDPIANVALTNAQNVFTANQFMQGANPLVVITDEASPANQRIFYVINTSQRFHFVATADDFSNNVSPLVLNRSGDITVARAIYEGQRANPLGYPVDVAFNPSAFGTSPPTASWTVVAGNIRAFSYALVGKMAYLTVAIENSVVSGAPDALMLANPIPTMPSRPAITASRIIVGGASEAGLAAVVAGDGAIYLLRAGGQPWVSPDQIVFSLTFFVT